jgi:predicted nucleic acid-binding protein
MSRRYRVWSLHKGYLLDTSVLSVLTPGREAFVPAHLPPWLQAQHDKLFIPCITIAELAQGIGKLRRAGGKERADRLDSWLDGLLSAYSERILPLDAQSARVAGHISDAAMAKLFASEALARVTDNALQIFGGMGLMNQLPIERFWRDARVERIWDGTSEIQRHIISRAMLRVHGG